VIADVAELYICQSPAEASACSDIFAGAEQLRVSGVRILPAFFPTPRLVNRRREPALPRGLFFFELAPEGLSQSKECQNGHDHNHKAHNVN